MFRKFLSIVSLLVAVFVVLPLSALAATPPSATASAPTVAASTPAAVSSAPSTGLHAVIVQVNKDKPEFDKVIKLLAEGPDPKLKAEIGQDCLKLKAIGEQLKKNPDSRDLQSQFEERLSEAMAKLKAYLGTVVEHEDEVINGVLRFRQRLGDASAAAAGNAREAEQRAASIRKQINEGEATLDDLAARFAGDLKAGKPLPADVDAQIVQLGATLEVRQMQERIAQKRREDAQRFAANYAAAAASLKGQEGSLRAHFIRAAGHIAVLNEAAAQRLSRVEERQMHEATSEIFKQLGRPGGPAMPSLDVLLPNDEPGTDPIIPVTPKAGRDILLRRINGVPSTAGGNNGNGTGGGASGASGGGK